MVLAVLFAAISLVASRLLNPPQPTEAKTAPYECGIVDQTDAPERFPVRFYLVAMIFIVFDIEIIFLYPFTTAYHDLGAFGLIAVVEFAVTVVASFAYLLANGALDWGPVTQARASRIHVGADRTTASTIRRVGLDGREPGGDAGVTIDRPAAAHETGEPASPAATPGEAA